MRNSRPAVVTKPRSLRVEVSNIVCNTSCRLRLPPATASIPASVRPKRPVAVRITTQGLSTNSALIEAALALLMAFISLSASSKVVRLSSPYFAATAASSSATRSRNTDSLPKMRCRAAISSSSCDFSDSSSIFENFVRRRSRSSRMYSA